MNDILVQTSWWVPCYGLLGALLTLPWSMGLVKQSGPRPAAYFNLLMTFLALNNLASRANSACISLAQSG
jgi:NAD(P)H-quinone oxidoreductase subunit 5